MPLSSDDPTPPMRPSVVVSMLDGLDGPGLDRLCVQLLEQLNARELPFRALSRLGDPQGAHYRRLISEVSYYRDFFRRWPENVTVKEDSGQRRVRREFNELARLVWVVLET